MRRTLAAAFLALAVTSTTASANPVKELLKSLDECMDCVPPPCQILLGSCARASLPSP